MSAQPIPANRRILVIDDNPSIHADFRKILEESGAGAGGALSLAEAGLFGDTNTPLAGRGFKLTSAFQGQEALNTVREACEAGLPFAVAFVDVRMPPGWDGIETTVRLWEADPDLQIVICTAYSDYSWDEMTARLGATDRMVILKKPFDVVEVLQLSNALSEKWALLQRSRIMVQDLEKAINERTGELRSSNEQLRGEIQERSVTEQALRATQEKLGHLLAKSPAVLYSLRMEAGNPVPAWVSDNFAGFIRGDLQDWYRQTPALEYVEESDREAVRASLDTLLADGNLSLQFRVRRKDGSVRWVRDDRQLLRDSGGHPAEIVGCWTDITEQRQLEEQLRQAQKMESIGQLAGGVAHDFNNLLTVILGYSEMTLKMEQLAPAVSDSLRQIHRAADRAGNLTRQLLAFSRKQIMRLDELDLNVLINSVTRLLGRTLGEHITVKARSTPDLPGVVADRGMIEQVIMNLAVNARDAMPEGGSLTIETAVRDIDEAYKQHQPDSHPGRFACFSIKDSGCGIPTEHLPHLFEPFFTTKEIGKGTGLGLATAYGIVKQHEGWIEVESRVGEGTTFRVYLPALGRLAATGQSAPAVSVRGGDETILVVEDEKALRGLISITLKRQGYHVHTAASGAEALACWADRLDEIDLVLTDVVMPDGLSGWELGKELQARKSALRVVYMSGYNAEMTVRNAVFSQVRFLQKPFGPQKLAESVRVCLDEEQGEVAARVAPPKEAAVSHA